MGIRPELSSTCSAAGPGMGPILRLTFILTVPTHDLSCAHQSLHDLAACDIEPEAGSISSARLCLTVSVALPSRCVVSRVSQGSGQ